MILIETETILLLLEQVCIGSLISGLIIFFLTLFLQGGHFFDSDTDFDHDVSLDHGDLNLDTDLSVDMDHGPDFHVDKEFGLKDHGFESDSPTPLMLLLGTFLITFGGIGLVLLQTNLEPFSIILFSFLIPILTTVGMSKIWSRVTVSDTYQTPLETIKIDDKVKTITTVDTDGGLVVIDTSSVQGPIKMAAKTKYGAIAKNMEAYVIDIQGNTLIIDEWSSVEEKQKPIPKDGSIKWE
ncbi:MAG: NfeD family protein [Candidatus Hodarchaeales archaeon]